MLLSQTTGALASLADTGKSLLPVPRDVVSVLCVSSSDSDHQKLDAIFSHSNWSLSHATDCNQALRLLQRLRSPVLICDRDVIGPSWRELLPRFHALHLRPEPRLIVSARLADDSLWSEVLNVGGYNVLEKPFDRKEVFWVVSHAWLDWKSERDRSGNRRAIAQCATT
jgi:DNA-binding NtrC family response regulator